MTANPDVVIVGAGLAGLCCARKLQEKGISFQILEASDGIGGRVRTDHVDGFLLDRGFQVLLEGYPEARQVLDYQALDLKSFDPGALIWFAGRLNRFIDPWRKTGEWRAAYDSPVGSFVDKLRLARLRMQLKGSSIEKIFARPEKSTMAELKSAGFSPAMIQHFFEPFFGGIMLDRDLHASSRMFEFVFSVMSNSKVCVPAQGMSEIPAQLAAKLPPDSIRLGTHVESLLSNTLTVGENEKITPRAVVVATDGPSAAKLLGEIPLAGSRSVTCFYYATDTPPVSEPILILAGTRGGTVNNLCVMSAVAPGYAPPGQHLISVSVLGDFPLTDDQLGGFIIADLKGWFGPVVRSWKFLRSYRIPHAQPAQPPGALEPPQRPVRIRPGVYVCGDHRDNASINGAMVSGRRAAEALISDLSK
ncbi:MAG TPA: NAD(P)/FAD-dependent oxidoreductase [Candidatus Acidoferrales bacterium]